MNESFKENISLVNFQKSAMQEEFCCDGLYTFLEVHHMWQSISHSKDR